MEEGGGAPGPGPDDRAVLSPAGVTRRPSWPWRVLGLARAALEVAVIAAVLWMFVFQVSVVSGHSMDGSLEPGDRLVVDKIGCRIWSPARFDVVVFSCPEGTGVDYVKRVAGLPGEEIDIRDGELYVNGARVEEPFDLVPDPASFGPVRVPEGHYFVLGDNRPRSRDSRSFGPIPRDLVKGVARFRVYPFGRAGSL